MGKSACSGLLRARGIVVVDTDDLARQVVEPGQPALAEISAAFGPHLVDAEGRLRRNEMARRAFADPAARRQLEQILHPRIRELWRAQVQTWRAQGHPLAVVVIPLLFETGAEKELDFTGCVACSAATQAARLAGRGWSAEQISQRLAAQLAPEEKMGKADFVLWNEADLQVLSAQIDRILIAVSA